MKIPAIKFEQGENILLSFSIDAQILIEHSYFKRRETERETGIQRDFKIARAKEIAKYIDSENPVLANNIVVNLELEKLGLKLEDVFCEKDKLLDVGLLIEEAIKKKYPNEERDKKFCFVIDGQHRLKAFEFARTKDFHLNITALIDLSLAEVAEIFVKINYYQRPINKSLVFDLLGISKDIFPEYYVLHNVVERLNCDLESPFYDNIKMLGTGKGIVTQASIISAIEKYKLKSTITHINLEADVNTFYNILWQYFTAIKKRFSTLWSTQSTVLTKTVGIRALFKLLNDVLQFYDKNEKDFGEVNLKEDFKKIDDDFWEDKNISIYGGEKGVKEIYKLMKEKIGV